MLMQQHDWEGVVVRLSRARLLDCVISYGLVLSFLSFVLLTD